LGLITTPANFCPTCSSRIMPRRMSRLPEQRFASQCPRSQHAALNSGLFWRGWSASLSLPDSSESRRGRGGPAPTGLPPLPRPPRAEYLLLGLKSFLWRTMVLCRDGLYECVGGAMRWLTSRLFSADQGPMTHDELSTSCAVCTLYFRNPQKYNTKQLCTRPLVVLYLLETTKV
jgi:hypothetical protein